MINFKNRLFKDFQLSGRCLLVSIIAPFLIAYPLYICNFNNSETYLIETEVYSNEEMSQIYKMIRTYHWSECGGDNIGFNKIMNYSVSPIPMQSSIKISLLSKDAEYGKSLIMKIYETANCVYEQSKKYEIEYLKQVESVTISRLNSSYKFLSANDEIFVENYLIGLREIYKLREIKAYLDRKPSDKLSITTSLYSERSLSYALIAIFLFVCELLILILKIFLHLRAKNV